MHHRTIHTLAPWDILLLHAALLIAFYHFFPVLVHPTLPSWPWMCPDGSRGSSKSTCSPLNWLTARSLDSPPFLPQPRARTSHSRFHRRVFSCLFRVRAQGQGLLMPPHLVLARSPSAPAQVQRSRACRVGGRLPQ